MKREQNSFKGKRKKGTLTKGALVSSQKTQRLLEQSPKRGETCQRMELDKFSAAKDPRTRHLACIFSSAVTAPAVSSSVGTCRTLPGSQKPEPFVSPELPRSHRPASYLFCPTIIDGVILLFSSQLSFVMCTRPCNNYMWFFLFNYAGIVSSSGFLTTDPFCKRFQVNYFISREYWIQKNAAPCHFFPFLKSSLLTPSWTWPCPCIRGFSGTDR